MTEFIGAYFNTFYNAKRLFTEAEEELLTQRENKQKGKPFGYLFLVQTTTKAKFASVIEKCSKLLQYHPKSNLVDDALLMIGKSYYYQNEYQQAERKFNELLSQFPESDLVREGSLLLGYTYYMINDKVKASGVAKSLLDNVSERGDDEYVAKASVLLAQLEVDNKNLEQARAYYQAAAEKGGTPEERCSAYLQLAELHGQEGNYQRALDAYRRGESVSGDFETEYRALVGQARMLSKLGAHEESLQLLRNLLSSSNYREFYGEISLEIGNVLKQSKDYQSAIAQYIYVDTAYARTEWSANSYFQLGDLYESKLYMLDSAQVFYSRGKSEAPQAAITPQIVQRADYLTKYVQLRNEIWKFDSIRTFILAPRDTTPIVSQDSTSDSLHRKVDSVAIQVPAVPLISLDSANTRLAYAKTELASLFYATMALPDSARQWYWRLLTEHPTSSLVPRSLFALGQIYSQDTTASRSMSDSLYGIIVTRFPDSEFAPEAARLLGLPKREKVGDPAEAAYARAEKLLNAGAPIAARDTLRAIVKTHPSSAVASKAQYALGWIYEQVSIQPDSAIASYRKLIAMYPGSKYAFAARPKVDEYDASKRAAELPSIDSTSSPKDSLQHGTTPDGKYLDPIKQTSPVIPPKQGKQE